MGEEHEEHVQRTNKRRVRFTPTPNVKIKGINGIIIKFGVGWWRSRDQEIPGRLRVEYTLLWSEWEMPITDLSGSAFAMWHVKDQTRGTMCNA